MALLARTISLRSIIGYSFIGSVGMSHTLSPTAAGCNHLLRNFFSRNFSGDQAGRGTIVLYQGIRKGEHDEVIKAKGRPNLVVSSDLVIAKTGNYLLAPLSTAPKRLDFEVLLPSDNQTNLARPSKVMANQIFTVNVGEGKIIKLGSAFFHMNVVDEALKICFGDIALTDRNINPLSIARGDFVKIVNGPDVFEGVVVSNDLGNRSSKIAMVADSAFRSKIGEGMTDFSLKVMVKYPTDLKEVLVHCHEINTFSQAVLTKQGKVRQEDMEKITEVLYFALGISK